MFERGLGPLGEGLGPFLAKTAVGPLPPKEMHLVFVNPLDLPDWDQKIQTFADFSFFHKAAWARVLTETYGYQPFYLVGQEDGEWMAVAPVMEVQSPFTGRRAVGLPFSDLCPPLLREPQWFNALFERLKQTGEQRGWRYIELRGHETYPEGQPFHAAYYLHKIDLGGDADNLFKGLKDGFKRNIRKAEREGVRVAFRRDLEAVKAFCRLNTLTRREHGLPPQPFRFFVNLQRFILARDLGFVALAEYQGKTIAGAVFFRFGGKGVYKYGASDKNYQHLRANNLLFWEAIKHLAETGIGELDLGRTDPDQEGLRRFKKGWGARETVVHYLRYDLKKRTFLPAEEKRSNLPEKILSRLPAPALRFLGRLVYRHMG